MRTRVLLLASLLGLVSFAFYNFRDIEPYQPQSIAHPTNSAPTVLTFSAEVAINPGPDQSIQKQIDDLLEEYRKALQDELQNGETIQVEDALGETTIMLAGASAIKIEALWRDTIQKINQLSARSSEERAAAVQIIQAIDQSGDVIYLDRDRSPHDIQAQLERYTTSKFIYSIDVETNQVIEISLVDDANVNLDPNFSQEELERKASGFISLVGAGVDLARLTFSVGEKSDAVFFFRWEDPNALLNGVPAFIQVGYSQSGDLVHYINTLPFVKQTGVLEGTIATVSSKVLAAPLFAFSQIYANGGNYWVPLGGSFTTQSNAGFCYPNRCSPTNFYWASTCYGCTTVSGRWNVNSSLQAVKDSAFVPSTHATTLQACYKSFYNGGASNYNKCINQSVYFNSWVAITSISLYDIRKIELGNVQDSSSLKEIAWDETWVYTP